MPTYSKIVNIRRSNMSYEPYPAIDISKDVKYETPKSTSEPMDTSSAFVFDFDPVPMEIWISDSKTNVFDQKVPFDKNYLPKDMLEFDNFALDRILVNRHKQLIASNKAIIRAAVWISCHGMNRVSTCFCGQLICSNMCELAHIVPASKGGSYSLDNLWASCKDCNDDMGNQHMNVWILQQKYDMRRLSRSPDLLAWSRYVASEGAKNPTFLRQFDGIEAHYFMKIRVIKMLTGETYPAIFDKICDNKVKNIGLVATVDSWFTTLTNSKTLSTQVQDIINKDKRYNNVSNVRREPVRYAST
jgi:5-methylcytosine-specific restriction endonuclease McrA